MKCEGNFVYKSLEKRDGGEFVNDKGQNVSYNSTYVVKVDEATPKGIYERKFKFPVSDQDLYNKFKSFEAYENVSIVFDISLYGSQAKVTPIDVTID